MSKLDRWRASKNYNSRFIADEIGCTAQTLWRWNNGGKISTTLRNRFIQRFGKDPVTDFGIEESFRVLGSDRYSRTRS